MLFNERREKIIRILKKENNAVKGQKLAELFNVTRQVIVKDIAILRAKGENILATPGGYMILKESKDVIKKIVAISHKAEDIKEELESIVKFGGRIIDVIVEHPLYGEIKGNIMIKTMYDIEKFIEKINTYKAKPLSLLTQGVHLHTIEADSQEVMDTIINKLKEKGFFIED